MITEEQYDIAKTVIEEYENDLRKKHVLPIVCIKCEAREIRPFYEDHLPDIDKREEGVWENGGVSLINFGYGSCRDMESYYIALCDSCIEKAIDRKVAILRKRK